MNSFEQKVFVNSISKLKYTVKLIGSTIQIDLLNNTENQQLCSGICLNEALLRVLYRFPFKPDGQLSQWLLSRIRDPKEIKRRLKVIKYQIYARQLGSAKMHSEAVKWYVAESYQRCAGELRKRQRIPPVASFAQCSLSYTFLAHILCMSKTLALQCVQKTQLRQPFATKALITRQGNAITHWWIFLRASLSYPALLGQKSNLKRTYFQKQIGMLGLS